MAVGFTGQHKTVKKHAKQNNAMPSILTSDSTTVTSINQQSQSPQQNAFGRYMLGLAASVLGHVVFGMQPPFARYLQNVTQIPTLLLLVISNLIAIAVYSPRIILLLLQRFVLSKKSKQVVVEREEEQEEEAIIVERVSSGREWWKQLFFKYFVLGIYVVSIVLRTITILISTKWTSALNVQLFSLSTPFIITILTIFVMNRYLPEEQKEQFSLNTFIITLVTIFGGTLIVVGNAVAQSTPDQHKWYSFLITWRIQWSLLTKNLTLMDLLGIAMTLFSSVCIVVYLLAMRFMKINTDPSAVKLSDESLYLLQEVSLVVSFIIPSLIMDDWSILIKLSLKDYLILGAHGLFIDLLGNLLNIFSVRELGPTVTASILSLRLVTAIVVGGFILNEWFVSVWQVIGSLIVGLAVATFMLIQYKEKQAKRRRLQSSMSVELELTTNVLDSPDQQQMDDEFSMDQPAVESPETTVVSMEEDQSLDDEKSSFYTAQVPPV